MKSVVFNFGRFQCPHIGHGKLLKTVKNVALLNNADAKVFISKTSNNKKGKNPLPFGCKVHWMMKSFNEYKDMFVTEHENDIFKIVISLFNEGYTDLICVVGSDWVDNLTSKLNHYNGELYNFNSIEVVSAGDRDVDSTSDIAVSSGSLIRELVSEGNLYEFTKYAPYGVNVLDYFNDVRKYI